MAAAMVSCVAEEVSVIRQFFRNAAGLSSAMSAFLIPPGQQGRLDHAFGHGGPSSGISACGSDRGDTKNGARVSRGD